MSKVSIDEVFEEFGLTAKWEAKGWEKGWKDGWEKSRQALETKNHALAEKDRENTELRRKLREAGIES
ncbi:MAG: hypothetical protein LBU16_00285 [Treponema sp.]|nr:hypothetical protein [Treponema sp.]